jgi:hypothetical protein
MPAQQTQVKLETMRIAGFPGGMNTSVPATQIEDGEAVRIRNFEYDEGDNLVTRNGVIGTQGIIGVWDETDWDASLWDSLGVTYSSPILSILDFEGATAFVGILFTVGTLLKSRTLNGAETNLTGALNLPDSVRWHWRIFNGVAVGVNGLTSGDNPIQVVAPAPGTASKLSTAPPGKFIEVWMNRLWIARSDQPNQIQCSDVGSHSNWNTDAGANPAHGSQWDLDKDDGDVITALYATKQRLFVFKENSIYVGEENPDHPSDVRFVTFTKYSSKVGCVACGTIQPVLDDVLFLSKYGVASLSAAQVVADFESALVSLKVADIQKIKQDLTQEDVCSIIIADRSQYWLCVNRNASATSEHITYVLDYRQLKKGIVRWVENDGLAFGTSLEIYDHGVNDVVYLIGCHDTVNDVYFIGKYIPKATNKTFIDSSLSIRKILTTKAYSFGSEDIRKYLSKWFTKLLLFTESLSLSISYYLDESPDATGTYSFNFDADIGGFLFDDPLTLFDDVAVFDEGGETVVKRIRKSFLYGEDKPRKAVTVQFTFLSDQVNQGFGIQGFSIKYQFLSEFQAESD